MEVIKGSVLETWGLTTTKYDQDDSKPKGWETEKSDPILENNVGKSMH